MKRAKTLFETKNSPIVEVTSVAAELKEKVSATGTTLPEELAPAFNIQDGYLQLAKYYEKEFFEDLQSLDIKMPDAVTRVSEYIEDVVKYVEKIIENGFAYESSGDVYFDLQAFQKAGYVYHKCSPNTSAEESAELLQEGEGALVREGIKRHPNDFALWKMSKPGEPEWDSPWGKGRPGWHIECSAMAGDLLGSNVDINCGGIDLRFPHHDNQLAQSEAKFGCKQWVNYFLHTGHLHIEGQKMSKSLKNFITIRACLEKYTANQIRILFLKHRFDSPIDVELVGDGRIVQMEEAVKLERTFSDFILNCKTLLRIQAPRDQTFLTQKWSDEDRALQKELISTQQAFHAALLDSLNTPVCIKALQKLVGATNTYMMNNHMEIKRNLLVSVLEYVAKSLAVFGVYANNDINSIGLQWEGSAPSVVEGLVAGVLDDFCARRDSIRQAARQKVSGDVIRTICTHEYSDQSVVDNSPIQQRILSAFIKFLSDVSEAADDPQKVLGLCDAVRDDIMPFLGVRFEDDAYQKGSSIWKLDTIASILADREQRKKEAAIAEKKKQEKERKKAEAEKQRRELAAIKPEEFFKKHPTWAGKFATYDDEGNPLTTTDGKPLSKGLVKKTKNALAKHKKFLASN
uniref:tRNA synthetases class I catalytic domain-containing protein n=1 Tax=Vannella robusta TaxID=1487602 RepID=A0A7S4IE33_9EUKA|mmetsp:Transcript_24454/g.31104  ORF Transcript_24454/g.31104 Transcript_24454/m.31104 type:complete len:630 (+) Transcript_24454:1-1890(+)